MTDLREKVARAAFNALAPQLGWEEGVRTEAAKAGWLKVGDAVLSIARPAIIEECAKVVDDFDWVLGSTTYKTRIAAAIRALAEKL